MNTTDCIVYGILVQENQIMDKKEIISLYKDVAKVSQSSATASVTHSLRRLFHQYGLIQPAGPRDNQYAVMPKEDRADSANESLPDWLVGMGSDDTQNDLFSWLTEAASEPVSQKPATKPINGTLPAYMKSQPTRSLTISHTTLYQAKSIVLYAPGKEHGERIPLYSPKVKVAITKTVPESWTLAHVVSGYNRIKIISDDESVEIPLQSDDLVCISADE